MVGQQALVVVEINLGPRHDSGTIAGSDFVLVGINQRIKRGAIDKALVDQKGFERLHPQRRIRRNHLVIVVMVVSVFVCMCMTGSHGSPPQRSLQT